MSTSASAKRPLRARGLIRGALRPDLTITEDEEVGDSADWPTLAREYESARED
ncbi:hypothetical protein [Mycetohabitans sp. B46]|uniref:hypothetical protein n=1 Tax=Mycetohabitans sp. B46 TaxID=2772536 RepID=UPI00307D02BF